MNDSIIEIANSLSGYRLRLNVITETLHNIYSMEAYTPTISLYPSTLYYLDYSKIHSIDTEAASEISFLILNTGSVSAAPKNINAIFVSRGYKTDEILSLVRNHISDSHMILEFTNRLFSEHSRHNHTVQGIMDMAFTFLKNPTAFYDAAFNLIAFAGNTPNDGYADKIIENGYLDPQSLKFLNETKIHDSVLKSDNPCLIKAYSTDRLAIRVNSTQGNIGHIVISAVNKPFQNIDYKLLRLLRDAIIQQLEHEDLIKNQYNTQLDFLLYDLLTDRIKTREHFQLRRNSISFLFPLKRISCIVIDLSLSQQHVITRQVISSLSRLLPNSYSMPFQSYIVSIASFEGLSLDTEKDLHAKINDLCSKSMIYAGESNFFEDLFLLNHYFDQALTTIQLNHSTGQKPGLFRYYNNAKQHFTKVFTENKNFRYDCHPAALMLEEYDKKKNTCLADSLYEYIVCERNAKLAASKLFVHRNTLNNRLETINSLLDIDLDDSYTREYLLLSFWCLKYYDK